jgi:hypothetical protein
VNDETLNKLVRWMNLLAEKLEYSEGTVAVALVNGKSEQSRILLSHTDALVGYKYCNGVDNNHPEEDVWVAHRWIADLKTHTQHRVLPKRLAEPINRLIAVVSDLHRNHAATS